MKLIEIKPTETLFFGNHQGLYINNEFIGFYDENEKTIKFNYELGYKDEYYRAKSLFFENRLQILKTLHKDYIRFEGEAL